MPSGLIELTIIPICAPDFQVLSIFRVSFSKFSESAFFCRHFCCYMLGDQNHVISTNFDVLREGQGLADRGTFVVDPDGVIQLAEITSEGVGRNASELLRKVKAAQYVRSHPGEVCPAKWEEGEKTLAPSLDLVGKI